MQKSKLFFIFFVLFNILPNVSYADIGKEMNKFWGNLGGSSNSNSAYSGQSTGYYTGGSINMRSPVIQQRPFSLQPPRINSGCGGIDMFTGSFSHINLDQFVAQMKAIGANSLGYAFNIGFKTLCPMCESVMNKMQEVADMINGFNINSCESGKLLADTLMDKNFSLVEAKCASMALISGSSSDADSAKSRCKSASAKSEENQKLDEEKRVTDINFVWQAMKKAGYVDVLGVETSEAFMSMVGTIILRQNDNPEFIKPLAVDIEYTKALINGGNVTIKECVDTAECLNVRDKAITLDSNTAYRPKILALLKSMQTKFISFASGGDESLTDGELALIGQTSIPVLRILVNTTTGKSPLSIDMVSELVARDTLNKFLQDISSVVRIQLTNLQLLNDNKDMIEIIAKNIDIINDYLGKEDTKIKSDLQQALNIIEANERFDRQLASSFSGHFKSVLDFSNSLGTGIR